MTQLTAHVSRELAQRLNGGRLPEGLVASEGAGMGYDGVVVEARDLDLVLYFDSTFGGDDGHSDTLRCYVTIAGVCVDHGWGLPDAPKVGAPELDLVAFISAATQVVVERVLREGAPRPN